MTARGFTLIELMVAVALFGLIAAGAMSLVVFGARSQAHSARVDAAQTALRASVDFITRDVMMASAGAAAGVITLPDGTSVGTVRYDLAANNSSTAPDTLELWLADGAPAAQLTSPVAAGATSLPIAYENGATRFFRVPATAAYPLFVQLSDPTLQSAVVTPLVSATGNALAVGALPATMNFPANAWVLPSKHVVYSITSAFGGVPMLMMTVNGVEQPLAEGVEDLQVAYGFDQNGDGILSDDGGSADEWLYNNPADNAASFAIGKLRAIRVTLVARSTSLDPGGQKYSARPAAEDRAAAAASDGYVRRVLRTEIAVRNFNL